MILELAQMALRELRRNALRSSLTALGIVIGVASVTLLVTLGRCATQKVESQIASLGTNLLVVTPEAASSNVRSAPRAFDVADVEGLRRILRGRAQVAGTSTSTEPFVRGNRHSAGVVLGVTNEYLEIRSLDLDAGRRFSQSELQRAAASCILGATVRNKLFGEDAALSQMVRVGKVSCRVVGILKGKGGSATGSDQDNIVVVPLALHQRRLSGEKTFQTLLVSVARETEVGEVRAELERTLDRRRHVGGQKRDFAVHDMKEAVRTLNEASGTLTALLTTVAAVSLLVGGIGIMNIMLVSVTERTREVGLRLALGASAGEILMQFLVEAVVLSSSGGLVGVGLGLVAALLATHALGLALTIYFDIIAVALSFSTLVGVVFGFLPARMAAQLSPIVALSRE